jgi:hypothetical protein
VTGLERDEPAHQRWALIGRRQLPQVELKVAQLRPTDAADLHFYALTLVTHALGLPF